MEAPTLKEREARERMEVILRQTRNALGRFADDPNVVCGLVYFGLVSERRAMRKGGPYATMMYAEYLKMGVDHLPPTTQYDQIRVIREGVMDDLHALRLYLAHGLTFSAYEHSMLNSAVADCHDCLVILQNRLGTM